MKFVKGESKSCVDNRTSLIYKHGDAIRAHETNMCFLCRCEYDGSFSCFEHGCQILNCKFARYGEADCCRHLKCKSIS